MFDYRRKGPLLLKAFIHRNSLTPNLWFLTQCCPSTFSAEYSTRSRKLESFTTSYLVDHCGCTPEIAVSISKHVNLKTSKKPDSVLTFFSNHGFSNSQILRLVQFEPKFLVSDPAERFLPKFDFLQSKGVSSSELTKMVTANPMFLSRSLKNHIVPCFDVLKTLLQSDERATSYMKRWTPLICRNYFRTNIQVLIDNGAPELYVRRLLLTRPLVFIMKPSTFCSGMETVKKLGISPSHSNFHLAFVALNGMRKAKWTEKIEIFNKWGWTEEVALAAFKKFPKLMLISATKIMKMMDFMVNQVGLDSLAIARLPVVLNFSFEKRIIPRTRILLFLSSKGLVKKTVTVTSLVVSEELFLRRYVQRFQQEAPQLMKLYLEKLNASILDI